MGIIVASGTGKQRSYQLSQKVHGTQEISTGSQRQTLTEDSELIKQILTKALSPNGVATRDLMKEMNLSKGQAYRILKNLVDSENLEKVGKGRSTHYVSKEGTNKTVST